MQIGPAELTTTGCQRGITRMPVKAAAPSLTLTLHNVDNPTPWVQQAKHVEKTRLHHTWQACI
jgi:hypothetical protein